MPSLASLASALDSSKIDELTSSAAILELDEQDEPVKYPLRFQYFPESVNDTKRVNWRTLDIPGGSLPIYQWVSAGERALTFEVVFTSDIDFSVEAHGLTKAQALFERLQSTGQLRRNIDGRAAVLWLRRFMMPRYSGGDQVRTGAPLTTPPRKFQLHMPGSGIGLAHGGLSNVHDGTDFITGILLDCNVTWQQYFPSGFPRITSVNLVVAQVAQYKGMVHFPAVTDELDSTVYGTASGASVGVAAGAAKRQVFPYPLRGRKASK